ncbi:hypothetical protein B9Z55_019378 [Caenorhabditis nigoni]|uniref:Uncharacterized protein n=2 Tax=Caenorhabditis nigoni TaxID=1611254 RepID=A0A2G5TIZ6_9PELO|nr:hypothetical protein B9Z55_019378 [Caenorhabditis nigoni]
MLFLDPIVWKGRNPAFEDYYQHFYLKNCRNETSFFEDPYNYAAITSAIATAVFPIHILAFYCILFKTPKTMDGIKKDLIVLHCWTFYCDNALNVLLIGYIFAPVFCGVPLGVLTYYGVPVVIIGYLGQIGVSGVGTSLVILFETRYTAVSPNSIFNKFPISKKLFLATNYIYTATFLIPAFYYWTPDDRQIEEKLNVLRVIPCPSPVFFEDQVVVGFPPDHTWIA